MHPSQLKRAKRRASRSIALLTSASLLFALGTAGCGDPRKDPKPTAKSSSSAATPLVTSSKFGPAASAGVDISSLGEKQKSDWFTGIDEALAPCSETPVPVGQCIAEKRGCKACVPAADFIARLIKLGAEKTVWMKFYQARFDPTATFTIPASSAPTKGPADAPVQLVEWADFTCPHCMGMRKWIDLMEERFPGQVRVTYRTYILSGPGHEQSPYAAAAARAAQNQDKFWEMHEQLFANQEHLEKKLILEIAKNLNLDMEKFKADFESDETKKYIEAEVKAADELGLDGTPFMFVNGRKLPLELIGAGSEGENWFKLEIELAGKTPAQPTAKYAALKLEVFGPEAPGTIELPLPTPSGSASAGPSAEPPSSASAGPSASAPSSASAGPSASAPASASAGPAPSASPSASARPKK
ncbi:MAG: thioredoxin domain-containing protein [Polyangiaceae bacterium]